MKTVYVGLSGGVDSAVSAALLKREGYRVVGAFIKIWRPEFSECPWREDRLDAMRVAAALQIPFEEIDLSEEYKKAVIDDLVENYARGITPNPDVLCNRHIKFGAFAAWARSRDADYVATGHYAATDGTHLMRGESSKDQSYFLYTLTSADLAHALFPVGSMPKTAVRKLAESFNLPVARKHDSQGLCFVGDVSMPEFLSRVIPVEKGIVRNMSGDVIGEHSGAALYTVGERHGFRVRTSDAQSQPQYVVRIDTRLNELVVSPQRKDAAVSRVTLLNATWVTSAPTPGTRLMAQARYRETPVPVTVIDAELVAFETPHLAPPGQSLVLYDGNQVVGGGIIAPTVHNTD